MRNHTIMRILIRQIRTLFRRPNVRFGLMMNSGRGRKSAVRNPQFIGFLDGSGFRTGNPVRQEKRMHRRRFAVQALAAVLFLGFVWVMIESAHALALF